LRAAAMGACPPVVGRRYLVPCVRARGRAPGQPDTLLPTLGPWHHDRDLAPEIGLHVHYDPRFFDLAHLVPEVRASAPDLPPEQLLLVVAHLPARGVSWEGPGDPLELAEMRCLRAMPPFPRGHSAAPWLPLAESLYAGARAARGADGCLRCPHRQTALDDLPTRGGSDRPHRECIHGLRVDGSGTVF